MPEGGSFMELILAFVLILILMIIPGPNYQRLFPKKKSLDRRVSHRRTLERRKKGLYNPLRKTGNKRILLSDRRTGFDRRKSPEGFIRSA